jgi:hypothetical protein
MCPVHAAQWHTVSHPRWLRRDGLHFVTPCATSVPTSKPRVGVTLDVEVYEAVKAIAQAENRSLANLIESWVLVELARHKGKA